MSEKKTAISPAAKLRAMLAEKDKIVVCPGVYDGFTARIALAAGFDCLYMTGSGTTMSKLGMADLGFATLNDMVGNAGMIASLDRSVPLIADADTGYGGPLMVGRTTAQYMQAGVAALHLEDQIQTKRCGYLRNKELVDEDVYISRIRAAVNMRAQTPGDIVIIARTDALQSLGYEGAVSRLKKAIAVGADVAFLQGVTSEEEARSLCQELAPTPVLLNMAASGETPNMSVREAKEMGFKIIIYPGFAVGPVYKAVAKVATELKETGDIKEGTSMGEPGVGPRELFGVCGLQEAIEFDIAAGGSLYSKGV